MAKMKELVLQVRYPYAAGVITAIWVGTALLIAVNNTLPITEMVVTSAIASVLIAIIGFSSVKR